MGRAGDGLPPTDSRGPDRRRRRGLAALAAVLALADAPAQAQSPGLELRWPTIAGCPTQAEVEATVSRLVAGGAPRPVTAAATLHQRDAPRWTLTLTLRDGDGEQTRVLTSLRCQALADAAAVILAVAAEPLAVATHVTPVAAAQPPAIASVVPAPPAPAIAFQPQPEPGPFDARPLAPAPAPPPRPAVRPRLGLDLQGAAALGPSGRAGPGLLLGLSLRWPRVRLQARASHWFASRVQHPERPDLGVTLRLTAATLRACPALVRGPVELELCGGLELGALRAEGDGLQQNRVQRGLWAAGVLAAGARYRALRWLALGLELEGTLAFVRHRYGAEDPGSQDFHVTPVLGVRGLGGLTFIFP